MRAALKKLTNTSGFINLQNRTLIISRAHRIIYPHIETLDFSSYLIHMEEKIIPIEYEERITAFVDILGFKDFLNKSSTTPDLILNLLSRQKSVATSNKDISSKETDFRIQSFSDNIVISVKNTSDAFSELVCYLVQLFEDSLDSGLFIRGGIEVANLYQNEEQNVVFGPGLVKAYELETRHADFPRIILSKKIVSIISKWRSNSSATAFHNPNNEFNSFCEYYIRQAKDGPYIINVIHDIILSGTDDKILSLKNRVEESLMATTDRPLVYKKIRKFAEYWNEVVDREGPFLGLTNSNHKIKLPYY